MTSSPPHRTLTGAEDHVTQTPLRRRYAVAGTGHRAWMYIDAILGAHAEVAELVAWCEPNPGRMDYYDEQVAEITEHGEPGRAGGSPLPRYAPDQLEKMIAEERVDVGVVTSPNYTHADLVSRTLAPSGSPAGRSRPCELRGVAA